MKIRSGHIAVATVALLVVGLTLVLTVHFADACRLESVRVDGEPMSEWQKSFDVLRPAALVSQQVDSLASVLLADEDVFKVDIDYRLPNELDIRLNDFEPVCYVVGKESGKLFGLNRNGRLIALKRSELDWERPVFTGVTTGNLHSFCRDPRVKIAIDQLEELREDNAGLYRLLDELDFSSSDHVRATIAGLPYYLWVRAERLTPDFERYLEFARNFQPDLADVYRMDLRYDDMIICARKDK